MDVRASMNTSRQSACGKSLDLRAQATARRTAMALWRSPTCTSTAPWRTSRLLSQAMLGISHQAASWRGSQHSWSICSARTISTMPSTKRISSLWKSSSTGTTSARPGTCISACGQLRWKEMRKVARRAWQGMGSASHGSTRRIASLYSVACSIIGTSSGNMGTGTPCGIAK